MPSPHPAALPVTVLTGFLGSGKTTLVNRVLSERSDERIAVLVNEFGDVPVDGQLVLSTDEEVVELANGCVCCSVRGDLVRALERVLTRRRPVDRILIETSGLASPGPVLQTLLVEPLLAERTRATGVVTMAHADLIVDLLAQHPEAGQQVGYADLLVLNHVDRASAERLASARASLRALNPGVSIVEATRAGVEVEPLFGARATSGPLDSTGVAPADAPAHSHSHGAGTVTLRSASPLRLDALKMWLQFLTLRRSHELWRIKGVLRCDALPRAVVVQSVYQYLELGPEEREPPSESVLVVIGRDLDAAELERGWAACGASPPASSPAPTGA